MAKYSIEDTTLTGIADAIRSKDGTTDPIAVPDMSSRIGAIETGSSFPNGTAWTKSNVTSGHFYRLCYGMGIWVAASYGKGLWYSTDGKTWTVSNISSGDFYCVAYGRATTGHRWLAGGPNGIYYSGDGKTWTQSDIDDMVVQHIYANKRMANVVVSSFGSGIYYYSTISSKSSGGKYQGQTNGQFYHIIHHNSTYIALSFGSGIFDIYDDSYYTSNSWRATNITTGQFYCGYSNGLIAVIGSFDNTGLYYYGSSTYTQSNITTGYIHCVYHANGVWAAGTSEGIYTSPDGEIWTQSDLTTGHIDCIYNANGVWVAGSRETKGLYYSVSWEPT